jgi:hypothetical protein
MDCLPVPCSACSFSHSSDGHIESMLPVLPPGIERFCNSDCCAGNVRLTASHRASAELPPHTFPSLVPVCPKTYGVGQKTGKLHVLFFFFFFFLVASKNQTNILSQVAILLRVVLKFAVVSYKGNNSSCEIVCG